MGDEEYVTFINQDRGGTAVQSVKVRPVSRKHPDHIRLISFAQERLWALEQARVDRLQHVFLIRSRLKGSVDTDLLAQSLNDVISRHKILRASFHDRNGHAFLAIVPELELNLSTVDLRAFSSVRQEEEMRRVADTAALAPFDLEDDLLIRAILVRLEEEKFTLIVCLHQIICDVKSAALLLKEVAVNYRNSSGGGHRSLPEVPFEYAEFAEWQRNQFAAGQYTAEVANFRKRVSGKLPLLELPRDHSRPLFPVCRASKIALELDQGTSDSLSRMSNRSGAAIETLLLAVFAVYLLRTTTQEELFIGIEADGRSLDGTQASIGPYANRAALVLKLSGDRAFPEAISDVQSAFSETVREQALPFERLITEWEPQHDSSHQPFQAAFSYNDISKEQEEFSGLELDFPEVEYPVTEFDLRVLWIQNDGAFSISLIFNASLFDPATQQQMANHHLVLLRSILANPEQRVAELDMLTPSERFQIVEQWNDTQTSFPDTFCLHELIESQAARIPDHLAIITDEQQINYGDLNRRANQLAHWLRALGVGPDVVVGICVERGVEMIVGVLGILKAGGAYLPLDPTYPPDRLAFLFEDAQAKVLLTQEQFADKLHCGGQVVCVDAQRRDIETMPEHNLSGIVRPENLAYVIYTSGSTGKPKGVMLNHRGRVNNFYDLGCRFNVTPEDRLLALASLSFDMSAYDTFGMLMAGATLVIPPPAVLDPALWLKSMLDHKVTLWHSVAALLEMLLKHVAADPQARNPRALRLVALGGDWIPVSLPDRVKALSNEIQVISIGGATEASMDSVIYPIESTDAGWESVPYGKPLSNQLTYVLERHLQPVPVGVPGELHLGGIGIAWGYFNRPGLTAERFIPNSFSQQPGDRLYKTGDLVRYRADGNLELLGRMDFQLKIRGFRVELGEIANVLNQHRLVAEAIVAARKDGAGNNQLVAYVVLRKSEETRSADIAHAGTEGLLNDPLALDGKSPALSSGRISPQNVAQELRSHLKQKLPDYMVPSAFLFLDAFPLTPNGKIDRQSLPEPNEASESDPSYVAPGTQVEQVLASLWSQLLGIKRVSAHDRFFDLGGHSLLAMQLISRVREIFDVELSARAVFTAANLEELGRHVEIAQRARHSVAVPPLVSAATRPLHVPVSFAQLRLWTVDILAPNNTSYNIPIAIRLTGNLDSGALEQSFNEIIRRHEILRTSFALEDMDPVQVIAPDLVLKIAVVDLSGSPSECAEEEVGQWILGEMSNPFDLSVSPLFRVKLLRLAKNDHVLVFIIHHVIFDGWSKGVLIHELCHFYQSFVAGTSPTLPSLQVQYGDFSLWQREWLQGDVLKNQMAYWKRQLAATPGVLELAIDHPRPPEPSHRGATLPFSVPQELTANLVQLSRREGVTLFMLLLAAFHALLHRYTGQEDIVIGSPVANRIHPSLEALIGFFVNMLVLRARPSGKLAFNKLLLQVREASLDAYSYQDTPFEKIVEELQRQRDLSRHPLFQVAFALQNAPAVKLDFPEIKAEIFPVEERTAKFDLTFLLEEEAGGLQGAFSYSTDLFDRSTAVRMLGHFREILESVIKGPRQELADLSLITAEERHQLLVEWNDTSDNFHEHPWVHVMFESAAAAAPDTAAILFRGQTVTYGELNSKSNRLARYLQRLGVRPELRVGVLMRRSPELIISLMAIVKAGGVYIPLDAGYPEERIRYMLADSQSAFLIVERSLMGQAPSYTGRLLCLEENWAEISREDPSNLNTVVTGENIAYVIYTSGSTGWPKGVAIRHSSVVALVCWCRRVFPKENMSGVLASTSICFDVSIFEIFVTLACGGAMLIVENALDVADMQDTGKVRIITAVPSAMRELARMKAIPDSVRTVGLGGEAVPVGLASEIFNASKVERLLNLYGPSEDTTYSTYAWLPRVREMHTVPVGRPVANAKMYILDEQRSMKLVPIGVVGELYIGGAGLSRGYLNRPDLTAEKFVPNPFSERGGERLYRTGDRVRYLASGELIFLERIDHQVKLRGHRIELGEIEAAIESHDRAEQAVVTACESQPGEKHLVAYFTGHGKIDTDELREILKRRLPEYMMPAIFLQLEAFPLTPNRKLDRRALPAPNWASAANAEIATPSTATEELLQELWAAVLSIEMKEIGVQQDFFEIGGHSLLAMQVASQIRRVFKVAISVREIFQLPTIKSQGEYIDEELMKDHQGD